MRARTILVIIILLVSIFLITSCGKKPDCETNSDCATGNPCITAKCTEGACVTKVLDGCCGNTKCETDENSCTCDKDCGKCEGKYKYNITVLGRQKVIETNFISQYCENDKCVRGVLPDKINEIMLTNDLMESGAFKAELLSKINNPFLVGSDIFNIRLLLKDNVFKDSWLEGNATFTRVQVLDGSEVLGEKMINKKLAKIGDIWTEELAIVSAQSAFEESKTLDVKLDYEYNIMQRTGRDIKTGEDIYEKFHKTSSTKLRLAEKIMFIRLPE
jgi:hypothetical protein